MSSPKPFKPLVVGAPRSGFALLCSVVIHFLPLARRAADQRQEVMNLLLRGVGDHIAESIAACFAVRGITNDLLYNPNFRYVLGGPKWIPADRRDAACFRKYIGVRGKGDFTLITRHPHQALQLDEVIHSHADPRLWLEHPGYAGHARFASVRSPVDILNSSVFSLNALASEYIQKFIPPEQDNDTIRQDLALYKFTDLEFFAGLARFLAGYFEEFMAVRDRYILMRWEDLIERPVPTILRLAGESGVEMTEAYAAGIWRKLDHVNLTQAHKHNFRAGHGVVGGWRNWITNHHLRMVRDHGLERHMLALGYGKIEPLDEARYTPFQQKVSACIDAGRVHTDFFDPDLFTFAFNKSNLDSDKFPFKRYGWRENTCIERSIFTDEGLQNAVWDAAEQACAEVNALLEGYLADSEGLGGEALLRLLGHLETEHRKTLGAALGKRYDEAFREASARVRSGLGTGPRPHTAQAPDAQGKTPTAPPRLIAMEAACNVVEYAGRFYALPHALGPVELERQEVDGLPGVLVTGDREKALEHARNHSQRGPQRGHDVRELLFFKPSVAACLERLRGRELPPGSRVVLQGWNDFAAELLRQAGNALPLALLATGAAQAAPEGIGRVAGLSPGDVLLANEFEPTALSGVLLQHLDAAAVTILAPITAHYHRNRPLFLISIPKGGTHLLYRLAQAAGYDQAVVHNGEPAPGGWYCVEYSNSHTVARDFFIDTVRREPFGNRHHPFPRTPALFIYRNPLDIVVSEANYYHREEATVFSSYLRHLDFEHRLLRLIDDPYLLGSIRDRINNFVPWFDFENVVPVSFEELIGSRGGGDDAVRDRLIWSLQLKLHLPGRPEKLAAEIFDEQSPTFHEGRIGSSRTKMTPEALAKFAALDQDFMRITGYGSGTPGQGGADYWERINTFPSRAEEFRTRPLRTSSIDYHGSPINIEMNYLRHNIVRLEGRYYALPLDVGPIDLTDPRLHRVLGKLLSSPDLGELKARIAAEHGER